MKITWHTDWTENEYNYFVKESDDTAWRQFWADRAIEVDDALMAEYDAALAAEHAASDRVREIEAKLIAPFKERERKEKEAQEKAERIEREKLRAARNAIRNARRKQDYFTKHPERAEPGWSERRRQGKLEGQGNDQGTIAS